MPWPLWWRCFDCRSTTTFMPQAMTGAAEGYEVFGVVGAAVVSCLDVVDFEEAGAVAAGGLAAMAVAGQDLASRTGWNRCRVTAALGANGSITVHSFGFGAAEFAFPSVGLDGHAAG